MVDRAMGRGSDGNDRGCLLALFFFSGKGLVCGIGGESIFGHVHASIQNILIEFDFRLSPSSIHPSIHSFIDIFCVHNFLICLLLMSQ